MELNHKAQAKFKRQQKRNLVAKYHKPKAHYHKPRTAYKRVKFDHHLETD